MDQSAWLTLGLMWLPIAMSALILWGSRRKMLARPNGRGLFQVLAGANIAVAIVAIGLTVVMLGQGAGKARAVADNHAGSVAQVS